MKISFEQRGGLAGIEISSSLDTDTVLPEEKQQIEGLIDNARFFNIPSKSASPSKGAADYYEYTITVESGEKKKHTVETTDLTMQKELKPLINYMRKRALNKF
jgi:hypothetical protein